MWWDVMPIAGMPDESHHRRFNDACLAVMEKTLYLESIACQENALHGLGHWSIYYGGKVEAIIDRYLAHNSELDEGLRVYALSARQGCIL
jgi:hypothetical protein